MGIKNDITFRGMAVTGAVLHISQVRIENGPTDEHKGVQIHYGIWASETAYGNSEEPLLRDVLTIQKSVDPASFSSFKSKMEEVGENAVSAAYVAVKQLADWTGATDTDLGDE